MDNWDEQKKFFPGDAGWLEGLERMEVGFTRPWSLYILITGLVAS